MSYNTYIASGRFTADGNPKDIPLRGNVDWMEVRNLTVSYAGGAGTGAEFYWQRDMTGGQGSIHRKLAADDSLTVGQLAAGTGFTLYEDPNDRFGLPIATTQANVRTISTGTTTGLVANVSVIQMLRQVGATQLAGIDFTVTTVTPATSFVINYMSNVANSGANAGAYRIVNRGSNGYHYAPTYRYISAITQAAQAVVTLTVTNTYVVGQEVKFTVPDEYGMSQMNGLIGKITAVNYTAGVTNTITVDINSTAFTAFAFPLNGVRFSPAIVEPVGTSSEYPNVDPAIVATHNTDIIYMHLAAGADSPAGMVGDVIYWRAGLNFSNTNEIV